MHVAKQESELAKYIPSNLLLTEEKTCFSITALNLSGVWSTPTNTGLLAYAVTSSDTSLTFNSCKYSRGAVRFTRNDGNTLAWWE